MKDFIAKYLTTEAVFIAGGLLWAGLSQAVPSLALIPVPAIAGVTPEFNIGPGHMIALGLVPIAMKIIVPGKTPFVSVVSPKTEETKDA